MDLYMFKCINSYSLDVEMRSVITLARMELNGVGFSHEESEIQKKLILAKMEDLEEEAYALAGHSFTLTSPEDICQVSLNYVEKSFQIIIYILCFRFCIEN